MQESVKTEPNIAVLIPCLNEQATIGKVIDDFRRELPLARIYVFDNNSTDGSDTIAKEHNAIVIKEPRPGKGNVIEAMFDRIEAEIYVMVDGDDTYPAESVHKLIEPVLSEGADMVVGARMSEYEKNSFRPFHMLGNNLVRSLVNRIYHADLRDIMSGYRAFNRRVVERIPVVSSGFEIETEMTIQSLYLRLKISEVPVPYRQRPADSQSKLHTLRDGFRVLWKIFSLCRAIKPLTFFGGMGLLMFFCGVLAGLPALHEYMADQRLQNLPLAVFAVGLMFASCGFVFLGIMLHVLNWRFLELHNVLTRRRTLFHSEKTKPLK